MSDRYQQLEALFLGLTDDEDLRSLVAGLDASGRLGAEMPGRSTPFGTLCHKAVDLLRRRGRIDCTLFQALADRAGNRLPEVADTARVFGLPDPVPALAPSTAVHERPSDFAPPAKSAQDTRTVPASIPFFHRRSFQVGLVLCSCLGAAGLLQSSWADEGDSSGAIDQLPTTFDQTSEPTHEGQSAQSAGGQVEPPGLPSKSPPPEGGSVAPKRSSADLGDGSSNGREISVGNIGCIGPSEGKDCIGYNFGTIDTTTPVVGKGLKSDMQLRRNPDGGFTLEGSSSIDELYIGKPASSEAQSTPSALSVR